MPLFDDNSDTEPEFKTENEYAKNYNVWRKKEELNRLKTKYGEDVDNDSSSSSSDDDEIGVELTEEVEKEFYKTLSCLKNKDPKIYDEKTTFFEEAVQPKQAPKKNKDNPMFLKDYERNLILEKGGQLSDSEEEGENPRARSPTYVEEQKRLKETLTNALKDENDDDQEWGGMFKPRAKTTEEKSIEETEYLQWLKGKNQELDDKETESSLKPLKDYWANPKLEEGEKFLRDYVLNKRFLENDNSDYIPSYDEVVHSDEELSEDEQTIEKQEEFEHKYNFRFEEPDENFIKRYPRTVEGSLRKTDDRRSVKRAETKDRKQKEKQEKMEDLRQLRDLKRKEIEEKIEKLKEITGNQQIAFDEHDLDDDFDPDAHDKKMQDLFNDEYYQGEEDDQKPEFPNLDEELELERWDKWDGNMEELNNETHCEDDNFNMDCDYDPQTSKQADTTKGNKKRKRKSKFAELLNQPKPNFNPSGNKTYEQYLDEYYKLDCEDIVGDTPCRFKYRQVVPNSFGLTVEEILTAKDKELNKWCSIKKAIQIRPDHVEKYDLIAFERKSQNLELKKKVLPSLFEAESKEKMVNTNANSDKEVASKKGKKGKIETVVREKNDGSNTEITNKIEKTDVAPKGKKRKIETVVKDTPVENDAKTINETENNTETSDEPIDKKIKLSKATQELSTTSETKELNSTTNETKKKSKNKKPNPTIPQTDESSKTDVTPSKKPKKKKKKNKNNQSNTTNQNIVKNETKNQNKKFTKAPKKTHGNKSNDTIGMSDARLTAYGLNPKKFKNKMKYGNNN